MASCASVTNAFIAKCCPTTEEGQVKAVTFIRGGVTITDPTNVADWEAALAADDLRVIPAVIGDKPVSTAAEGPGFGWDSFETIGRDHVLNFRCKFNRANQEFFNQLNKDSSWTMVFCTKTNLFMTNVSVNVNADVVIAEDKNTQVTHNVVIKWKNMDLTTVIELTTALEAFFRTCSE